MKILSFIAFQLIFISGLFAQLASVDSDYKSERIKYLKSELNLSKEQVKELTFRFKEIVPEKSAADWKKTRMAYERILLEVLNISQQNQLGETYGFNRQCFATKANNLPTIHKPQSNSVGANSLTLAPNPTSDYVTLSYEVGTTGNVLLELKDEQGITIEVIAQGLVDAGSYVKRIDLTRLVSNVYFVTLRSDTEVITEKLILQK